MEIVTLCPLRAASFEWSPARGGHARTVVVKATYRLRAGEMDLADDQDPIEEHDRPWSDAPNAALRLPTDLVPFKPRADVLLMGHAYAPPGTRACTARLAVAEVDKSIEVTGRRAWGADGRPGEPALFEKMPLRWELAAGGPGTANPAGLSPEAPDVPSLGVPGQPITDRRAPPRPIGFGPIAPAWPGRVDRLGGLDPAWSRTRWTEAPLPATLDPAYFNVAPPDQQAKALRGNEALLLKNLRPGQPHVVMRLPGLVPRCFVERPGQPPQEVQLACDTLIVDTDRGVCTATYRGQLPLPARGGEGRVLIAMDQGGSRLTWTDLARRSPSPYAPEAAEAKAALAPGRLDVTAEVPVTAERAPALPFQPTEPGPTARTPTLPFQPAEPGPTTRTPAAGPWSSARAASDAATAAPPRTPARAPEPPPRREAERSLPLAPILDLTWFDATVAPRLRRRPAWKKLLDDLEREPADPDLDDPSAEPARAVFAILARGAPIDAAGVAEAFAAAVRPDGRFVPPLVVMGGELSLAFDEGLALQATTAQLTPLVGADRTLEAAVAAASAALAAPGFKGGLPALTRRLREAFAAGKRAIGPETLDAAVERALLEQRAYQRRTVLGEPHLGASLHLGAGEPLPVYLPETAAARLPLFARFEVRVLGALHGQEDAHEAPGCCLRALAIGRVLSAPPRR